MHSLSVRTEGGASVSTSSGTLNRRKTRVSVRLRSGLAAGRYTATVNFLAADGHAQKKTWSFRLR